MADECLPQVQACAIRVSQLDPNGVPTPGANNLIVSSALTELTYTPVFQDGIEITQPNACGDLCIDYKGPPRKRRIDVALTICTHDPYLLSFLDGGDVLTDGAAKGYAAAPIGVLDETRLLSIEVWAKRINDGILDPDFPYAWWAFPLIKNLREGAGTFTATGAKLPTFTGEGYENVNWFDGPLNDWPATSDRTHQWIPTTTLPVAQCGFQTVAAS